VLRYSAGMKNKSDRQGQIHAVILAAGTGSRAGLPVPKQFSNIGGMPLIMHSYQAFKNHSDIDHIWIVLADKQQDIFDSILHEHAPGSGKQDARHIVPGGATRQESVKNALDAICEYTEQIRNDDIVLIHDAARPFLSAAIISDLISALTKKDGVFPALAMADSLVNAPEGIYREPVDRTALYRVQTPQAFRLEALLEGHRNWDGAQPATDDAQMVKAAGYNIGIIPGTEDLKKYTFQEDFSDDEDRKDRNGGTMIRTGMGYDVHRLAKGEELWLGGAKIDHDYGLHGHSDADVLLHAITDALLGSISAGDIGDHFPPSDPQWKGASSDQFLIHAADLVRQHGGHINHIDATVICEEPKIKPHRQTIRQNIARFTKISIDQVSIKATTTEGLGFTGKKEGIAAQAIATVALP